MLQKLACTLITAGLLLACGGGTREEKANEAARAAAEKAAAKAIQKESGKKADVKITDEGMPMKTDKGEKMEISTGGATKVPEGFPADVLVYKKAKLITSTKMENTIQLQFQSEDSPAAVQEAYKKEMTAQGWKENMAMASGGVTMLHYEKDGRRAMIHIVPGDKEGSTFSVVIEGPEKK
jgi:hypothetical protein